VRGLWAGERRTKRYVETSYDATWKRRDWPEMQVAPRPRSSYPLSEQMPARWGDQGLVLRRIGSLKRLHLAYLERVLELLKPRSVLEVGSGNGINLLVIAGRFPEIEFTGVELTANGVARSQAAQAEPEFPKALHEYCAWETLDPDAYRRIEFIQADASKLPFPDDHFDLVFSHKALEQMEMIREQAVAEIARVTREHTVHFEPFADFNQDWLQRTYVSTKAYFAMPLADLDKFGIDLIHRDIAMPYNIELASGLVIGRKRPKG
jgi:SAM-dependent methyltransferase